jgi:hypothetical protein
MQLSGSHRPNKGFSRGLPVVSLLVQGTFSRFKSSVFTTASLWQTRCFKILSDLKHGKRIKKLCGTNEFHLELAPKAVKSHKILPTSYLRTHQQSSRERERDQLQKDLKDAGTDLPPGQRQQVHDQKQRHQCGVGAVLGWSEQPSEDHVVEVIDEIDRDDAQHQNRHGCRR